jgi:aldose 1-epimerase
VIGRRQIEGFEALTLSSGSGRLEAAFVPEAGMVGCSLRHQGQELLGQRGGLAHYVSHRSTMGIPLLYPWANRLSCRRFSVAGRQVDLDARPELVASDPHGLPIHGLLAGAHGWSVERHEEMEGGGALRAAFDFGAHPDLLEAFPFPHEVAIEATLVDATLTIETMVRASPGIEVPVAFGFHPYLGLPGVARADWVLGVPVTERLEVDEHMIPTGMRRPVQIDGGPLGSRTFDDEYVAPANSADMTLAGGGRRIEVSLGEGYPYTQVYAPQDDDVIAFEPMTAPTNSLVVGGSELTVVPAGESHRTEFTIEVLQGV